MNSRRRALKTTRRRGAACIEFAIAASLLVLILLGCVDLGRFLYIYVTVSNSAREGANFGSLHGIPEFGSISNWEAAVANAAVDETTVLPIDAGDVTVDTASLSSGIVRVEVVHDFEMLIPWPGLPETVTLTRTVVMPQTP